jgi:hypothetical protein
MSEQKKDFQKDPDEIGSVWKDTDKNGNPYYSVTLDIERFLQSGGRVMAFPNKSGKGPVLRLKLPRQQGGYQEQPRPKATRPQVEPTVADDDIPF